MDKTPGQILFERRYREEEKSQTWNYLTPSRQLFYEECAVILDECSPKPEIYVTAERPPEEEDAKDTFGRVLALWKGSAMQFWTATEWHVVESDRTRYTHWQRQPPAPVSDEDRAFEELWANCNVIQEYPASEGACKKNARDFFNAALAYARGQKGNS